jgi:hypothetical protein
MENRNNTDQNLAHQVTTPEGVFVKMCAYLFNNCQTGQTVKTVQMKPLGLVCKVG